MNIYRILNVLFHVLVPFIWIGNILVLLHNGLFYCNGITGIVVVLLPIAYITFWIIVYPRFRQPTVWKTIWFIIKNK